MQKIVLTGGGSGGHILPSIALLPELRKHFDEIYYIGEENGMEEKIAKENNLIFYPTRAIKFRRDKILANLAIPFVLPSAVNKMCKLLKELCPDVLFSKGGYVSLPATLAAERLKIPVVIHESDGSLGLANKIAAKHASYIITTSETAGLKNNIVLPNPIREEIFNGNKSVIYDTLHIRTNRKNILVLGGSLGAQAINNVIKKCIWQLTDDYNIIHITGKGKSCDISADGYYPVEYADNIGDYYAAADLVISRAGAGVIQELLALGKKAILIPLPSACSRGDQLANAKNTPYRVIEQDKLNINTLLSAIDESVCVTVTPNYDRTTCKKIVDVILRAKKS